MARSPYGGERALMVDAQRANYANLKDFRRGVHKAILLDEVMGPELIILRTPNVKYHSPPSEPDGGGLVIDICCGATSELVCARLVGSVRPSEDLRFCRSEARRTSQTHVTAA